MSGPQFTPGAWGFHDYGNPTLRRCEANGPDYEYADYCIGVGDKMIATVQLSRGAINPGYPAVEDEAEFTANAHLIAAAPELYEALEDIVRRGTSRGPADDDALAAAKTALRKARGETA